MLHFLDIFRVLFTVFYFFKASPLPSASATPRHLVFQFLHLHTHLIFEVSLNIFNFPKLPKRLQSPSCNSHVMLTLLMLEKDLIILQLFCFVEFRIKEKMKLLRTFVESKITLFLFNYFLISLNFVGQKEEK